MHCTYTVDSHDTNTLSITEHQEDAASWLWLQMCVILQIHKGSVSIIYEQCITRDWQCFINTWDVIQNEFAKHLKQDTAVGWLPLAKTWPNIMYGSLSLSGTSLITIYLIYSSLHILSKINLRFISICKLNIMCQTTYIITWIFRLFKKNAYLSIILKPDSLISKNPSTK